MPKRSGNKARNQIRGRGTVNARWFDKGTARRRKRNKLAKKSRKANR